MKSLFKAASWDSQELKKNGDRDRKREREKKKHDSHKLGGKSSHCVVNRLCLLVLPFAQSSPKMPEMNNATHNCIKHL